jgi:hypothetical protein
LESYRHWITGVDCYLRYLKDEYNDDDDKNILVRSIFREKVSAWYNNRENSSGSIFRLIHGWCSPVLWRNNSSTRRKKRNASRIKKKLQSTGDIQDYIVKMKDLNYHVSISGIAW